MLPLFKLFSGSMLGVISKIAPLILYYYVRNLQPENTQIVFLLSNVSFVLGLSLTWVNFLSLKNISGQWIDRNWFILLLLVLALLSFYLDEFVFIFALIIFARFDAKSMETGSLRWIFLVRLVFFTTMLFGLTFGVILDVNLLVFSLLPVAILAMAYQTDKVRCHRSRLNGKNIVELALYIAVSLPILFVRTTLFYKAAPDTYLVFEDFIRAVEIGVTSATIYVSSRFSVQLKVRVIDWLLIIYSFILNLCYLLTIYLLVTSPFLNIILFENLNFKSILDTYSFWTLSLFSILLLLRVYTQRMFTSSEIAIQLKAVWVLGSLSTMTFLVQLAPMNWLSILSLYFSCELLFCFFIAKHGGFKNFTVATRKG